MTGSLRRRWTCKTRRTTLGDTCNWKSIALPCPRSSRPVRICKSLTRCESKVTCHSLDASTRRAWRTLRARRVVEASSCIHLLSCRRRLAHLLLSASRYLLSSMVDVSDATWTVPIRRPRRCQITPTNNSNTCRGRWGGWRPPSSIRRWA